MAKSAQRPAASLASASPWGVRPFDPAPDGLILQLVHAEQGTAPPIALLMNGRRAEQMKHSPPAENWGGRDHPSGPPADPSTRHTPPNGARESLDRATLLRAEIFNACGRSKVGF
jgi:hypothetical protein